MGERRETRFAQDTSLPKCSCTRCASDRGAPRAQPRSRTAARAHGGVRGTGSPLCSQKHSTVAKGPQMAFSSLARVWNSRSQPVPACSRRGRTHTGPAGTESAAGGDSHCTGAADGPKHSWLTPKWHGWSSHATEPAVLPFPEPCPGTASAGDGDLALPGGSCCSPINPLSLFISIYDSQTFFLLLNCQFPEKPSQAANRLQSSDLVTGDNWEK